MSASRAAVLCAAAWLAAGLLLGEGPETDLSAASEPAPAPVPPAEKPAVEYIPMRGVALRTSDGLFEIALGFTLQFRYTRFDFDGVSGASPDADEFRIRKLKVFLTGFTVDPRLTYRLQAAFENVNTPKLLLDDAWLNFKLIDQLGFQAGQSKTPYSRQELYNEAVVQFSERASSVEAFKPGRDIGGGVLGSFSGGKLNYMVGVFGGAGQSTLRARDHVMPMVRIVLNPIGQMGPAESDLEGHSSPALSFGVDGFTNTLQKVGDNLLESNTPNYASPTGWLGRSIALFRTGEDISVESASADLQFKWRGLAVQGEHFWGHARGEASGFVLRASGWYGQASYFILPHRLDLGVRYSSVDPDRARPNDVSSVLTVAPTWYFRGNNVKMQIDYSRTRRALAAGGAANDQLIRLQVQLAL